MTKTKDQEIKLICVEVDGYIYPDTENPIIRIEKNGEMAKVAWYRKGNVEWNGRYVIKIEYEN